MLIFASNAGANQLEQFGSLAAGSPVYVTPDAAAIPIIQALSNYLEGWFGGVVGSNLPAIEDMNAMFYLFAYQLAYNFQAGIAEWDAGTTYYQNSLVTSGSDIYRSLTDTNLNNPVTDATNWANATQSKNTVFTSSGTFIAPSGISRVRIIGDFTSFINDYNLAGYNNTTSQGIIDKNSNLWMFGGNIPNGVSGLPTYSSPVLIVGAGELKVRQFGGGSQITSGLIDTSGNLYCWGVNDNGQIGNGTQSNSTVYSTPTVVVGPTHFSRFVDGSFIQDTVAAFDADGNIWMWGVGIKGQLGNGTHTTVSSPVKVVGGHNFVDATLCYQAVIALDSAGAAWAWGENQEGILGNGNVVSQSSPVAVLGSHVWRRIVTSNFSNGLPGRYCIGLDTAGKAWSWGYNNFGQLGLGDVVARSSPVAVLGSIVFAELMRGQTQLNLSTGGVDVNGNIWMWGDNEYGQCGNHTATISFSSPIQVIGGVTFAKVFTDYQAQTIFGLDTAGNLWAWGRNNFGLLGANLDPASTLGVSSPVMVAGGIQWKWFLGSNAGDSGSSQSVYGIDVNGQMWAWGFNAAGQLGDGTIVDKSSPVMVLNPTRPYLINPLPAVMELDVVPGQSYAVNLSWASTFGGTIVGYLCKKITVNYA